MRKRRRLAEGLLVGLLTAPWASAASIVLNGGFETGNFNNWTLSGNTSFGVGVCLVNSNFQGSICTVHSGSYAAMFGPSGSLGYISQTLTTVTGGMYNLTLYLRNDNLKSTPVNQFHIYIGGTDVYNFSNAADFNYKPISLSFFAVSTTTSLQFGFRNDPGGFYIDDISVDRISEPATMTLIGTGLLLAVGLNRRRSGLE